MNRTINTTKLAALTLITSASLWLPVAVEADTLGGKAKHALDSSLSLVSIDNTIDIPWGIADLPNGDLLVTERSGKLYRLDRQGERSDINGVPNVRSQGQGGLLDVAVHPDFKQTPWVYFSYSKPLGNAGQTAIARATLQGNELIDWTDLYIGDNPSSRGHHYGSRLALLDGYVFFTIGDRGNREQNPQNLSRDGGKVYRLHDDGRIPSDNPFVNTEGAHAAIWSYGHRNPQGLSYDTHGQQLWLHEHGPKGGDELNLIEPGNNYGWPLTTYGINYNGTQITDQQTLAGSTQPAWHWTPSIAPSGLTSVSKAKYPSLGDGLLVGSLKFGELHFREHGEQQDFRVVMNRLQRVRSLTTAADGTIYIGISHAGVFRLVDRDALSD